MARCDAQDLLDAGKCFGCFNQQQAFQAQLALLCAILRARNPMASCDPNELLDAGRCFACLDEKSAWMVSLQLLCEILVAGGGGSSTCNLCGTVDPTAIVPTCDCALYTNTANGEFWFWQPVELVWKKLISNT